MLAEMHKERPTCRLVYVTPEKLAKSDALWSCLEDLHANGQLTRFVVDEAHCVSSWGRFPPGLQKIGRLEETLPGRADDGADRHRHSGSPRGRPEDARNQERSRVRRHLQPSKHRDDGEEQEELPGRVQIGGMARRPVRRRKAGIVYCLSATRPNSSQPPSTTNGKARARERLSPGPAAVVYNAGMSTSARVASQNAWMRGDARAVTCATIAFGMGIDKKDVRYVVHYSAPKSLEGLYQEIGRAEEMGKPAEAVTLYAKSDVTRLRRMMSMPSPGVRRADRLRRANRCCAWVWRLLAEQDGVSSGADARVPGRDGVHARDVRWNVRHVSAREGGLPLGEPDTWEEDIKTDKATRAKPGTGRGEGWAEAQDETKGEEESGGAA